MYEGSQSRNSSRNCEGTVLPDGLLSGFCLSDFLMEPRPTFIRMVLTSSHQSVIKTMVTCYFDMREKSFSWESLLCLLHIISGYAFPWLDMLFFPLPILIGYLLLIFIAQFQTMVFVCFGLVFWKPFKDLSGLPPPIKGELSF